MSAGKKKSAHRPEDVWRHLRARHGGCPDEIAEEIVTRVSGRKWTPPVEIGRAVGMIAASLVRHRMTDYDRLLEVDGLTRGEAQQIVEPEVKAIIGSWRSY